MRAAAALVLLLLAAPAAAQDAMRLPRVEVPRGLSGQPAPASVPVVPAIPAPRRALPAPAPAGPANPEDWTLCRPAILAAEAEFGIPPFLLLAIGRAETGRRSAVTGRTEPWPWAINVDGAGYYLNSREEAITFVTAARQVARSIDVGCMQVSLLHHPNAFPTIADGFDPVTNARYAARFLADLRNRLGGWLPAIGAYHSGTEWRAEPYRARVLANWASEGGNAAMLGVAQAARGGLLAGSLSRWFSVQVVTPAAASASPATAADQAPQPARQVAPRRGMTVIVPSR
jgi:soluble lytic murein transglycosylase-like protein